MTASPRPMLLAVLALAAGVALVGLRDSYAGLCGLRLRCADCPRPLPDRPARVLPDLPRRDRGDQRHSPDGGLRLRALPRRAAAGPRRRNGACRMLGGRNPSDFDGRGGRLRRDRVPRRGGGGGPRPHPALAHQPAGHLRRRHRRSAVRLRRPGGLPCAIRGLAGSDPDGHQRDRPVLPGGLPPAGRLASPPQVQAFAEGCLTCHLDAELRRSAGIPALSPAAPPAMRSATGKAPIPGATGRHPRGMKRGTPQRTG